MEFNSYGEIVKVSNSLRKYYGLNTYHPTDPITDEWLNKNNYRCVITLLIDAMGSSILYKHLDENGFFLSHNKKDITTVFPPTTSAATTSFRNGKMPIENGWLGWNQYFEEVDDEVILFFSKGQYTGLEYPEFINTALPVSEMGDELHAIGVNSDTVWPGWSKHNPSQSFQDLLNHTKKIANQTNMHYIYAYWDQFDTLMHRVGTNDSSVKEVLMDLEKRCEEFSKTLADDCGLMIIADHSQIDVYQKDISKEKELLSCLNHLPTLEPRTISFSVKEEYKDKFIQLFHQFTNEYQLYTKDEVIEKQMFGRGIPHKRSMEFIGDFIAVATSNLQIIYGDKKVRADHAGGMKEEAMIPLILI